MTALDLYKFITENQVEYHWHTNPHNHYTGAEEQDVIMFVHITEIGEFNSLLSRSTIMDEEGIKCTMKDGYFAFWMKDICDYFDIPMIEVFDKK